MCVLYMCGIYILYNLESKLNLKFQLSMEQAVHRVYANFSH